MKASVVTRPAAVTGLVLLIPLVMTWIDRDRAAGDGWHWSLTDFLVMGVLIFGAGVAYQLVSRLLTTPLHRRLLGIGILAVVVAIWTELAVGAISQLLRWLGV